MHGRGIVIEPKQIDENGFDWGTDMEGEFKKGQLIKGIKKGRDGAVWEGEFQSGELNGMGTFKHPVGKIERGIFSNGNLITCIPQQ